MKGKRMLAVGLAAGMVFGLSAQAFADPLIQAVQAKINPQYHMTFDGVKKDLPEGYEILIYEDRTYVPARIIAEELGATVTWHEETKEIEIVAAKTPEIPTVPETESLDYRKLPFTKETEQYKVEAFLYQKDTNNGDQRVWFRVTNKLDQPLLLNQSSTIFVENKVTYEMNTAEAADYDKRWYKEIKKDEIVEGYILLPRKIKLPEKLHVELTLDWIGGSGTVEKTEIIPFDIAL